MPQTGTKKLMEEALHQEKEAGQDRRRGVGDKIKFGGSPEEITHLFKGLNKVQSRKDQTNPG